MRNLKKILALVLAMVMTFSVMATANAALTDLDTVDASYEEAVTVLTGMGVFKGRTAADGSTYFAPEATITRQEVATIIYRIASGDVTDAQKNLYIEGADFADVKPTDWAAGYIGYAANGGLVQGYAGKFNPTDEVTGVQVLAMILRAVGYDANDEFTGADWDDRVMSTAQSLGILKNVKAATLVKPASRELVAELLFRTIAAVDQVEYTPALGYQPVKIWFAQTATIGEEKFNLVKSDYEDIWGRPGYKWTYNVGDKSSTFMDTPVYTNTVKVDECDVALALGLSKAAAIEKAYIDGVNTTVTNATVTTDRNGKIDPLNTTSLIGAQGRILEVYDMGTAGYRLVEINTYLGIVDKVTPAYTDRNGHVSAATIDLTIYDGDTTVTNWDKNGVSATGYNKGDYVLVNITLDDGKVRVVSPATVTPAGAHTNWTLGYGTVAATTTVGATTYNDADKFELGYAKAARSGSWDVITDAEGNLIGMIPSAKSFLVIEKMAWKQASTTVAGGYAMADLVLADGTKVPGAIIASVNGAATTNLDEVGQLAGAKVSDDYTNNTAYYKHLYTYAVNADGSYSLTGYCWAVNNASAPTVHNTAITTITTGKTSTIQDNTNTVVCNDNTVFLVMDKTATGADANSYTAYYGVNSIPSMSVPAYGLCYLSDGTYATLVVINNYELAGNKFVAYAPAQDGYAVGYNPVTYSYTVYKAGSTEATTIYSTNANLFTVDGFYQIELTAGQYATTSTVTQIMGTYGTGHTEAGKYAGGTAANLYWERGYVGDYAGNSLTNTYADNTAFNDYRTNENTKFFDITMYVYAGTGTAQTVITAGDNVLETDERIVVAYTGTGNNEVATYVYTLKTVTDGQATVTNPWAPSGITGYDVNTTDDLLYVANSNIKSLGQMVTDWTAPGYVVTITVNGTTNVVATTNTESVYSAIVRGATVTLSNGTDSYAVVISK